MNMVRINSAIIAMVITATFILSSVMASAQTENVKTSTKDTTGNVKTSVKDTTQKVEATKEKKPDRRRRDEFIVYAGVNFNQLSVSSSVYESAMKPGFHLGFNYKRGKFFYWEIGGRYSYAAYQLKPILHPDTSASFGVSSIDVPVTGGVNLLYFMNRIVALRLFLSAVPSFAVGISENDLGIQKAGINTFSLYARGGLGINVAFFILEAGYNYGFTDIIKTAETKPGQIFINLGFRF